MSIKNETLRKNKILKEMPAKYDKLLLAYEEGRELVKEANDQITYLLSVIERKEEEIKLQNEYIDKLESTLYFKIIQKIKSLFK